jgi:hypothetical protein
MSKTEKIKLGPQTLSVSRLVFDKENYRLPPEAIAFSQEELGSWLEEESDLFPIARSMADNGYFAEEPLIGIPGLNDTVIVVEGNRRLATLKFLTDPEFRKLSENKDEWEGLSAKAEENGHNLKEAPVVVHKSREELTAILGFRHITGTAKWNPLSKARFVHDLIEHRQAKNFYEIAREVGSKQDTIRSNYVAYNLYKQAKDLNIDTSKVEMKFGVFYTALNNSNIREYIGLDPDKSPQKLKKPISNKKAGELKNLIEDLHGTSEIEAIILDSRDIWKLGEILVSAEARKVLHTTRDLDLAFRSTGGEEKALLDNLETASIYLTEAYKTVYLYCKNPTVRNLIARCAGTIEQILRSCPESSQKTAIDRSIG